MIQDAAVLRWYGRTDIIFQVGLAHVFFFPFLLLVCKPHPFSSSSSSSFSSSSYSSAFSSHYYFSSSSFFSSIFIFSPQVMRPMLYGADVEVINVLHPCMIQLLPVMVGPTPKDIVLPLKVTHVHHMVLGLPECVVISLICHLHVHVHVC